MIIIQNLPFYSYEEALSKVQTGDILLCSGHYMISRLIGFFSRSSFSHVGVIVKWENRILVMESVEDDGVRIVPLSHYFKNYENKNESYRGKLFIARHDKFMSDNVSEEEKKRLIDKGISLLNRHYDKFEILKILLRIVFKVPNYKQNNQYICSEHIDILYKEANITLAPLQCRPLFPKHIAKDKSITFLFRLL
ncbi:YiiX/YebB-like N1pC/P60 family cysteine hydrolase [Priestia filamentosa]|uniref:YiiX/YebB-like N1pC/P60 family cysteine hydrolase n=1 Tax=Priestia filamentosa TaxID=1402861 RepID=UPI002E20D37E|nr:YiiX/YebB-like N1pC/P60 family cysteine hydrolase [Priestia filamentosa]